MVKNHQKASKHIVLAQSFYIYATNGNDLEFYKSLEEVEQEGINVVRFSTQKIEEEGADVILNLISAILIEKNINFFQQKCFGHQLGLGTIVYWERYHIHSQLLALFE